MLLRFRDVQILKLTGTKGFCPISSDFGDTAAQKSSKTGQKLTFCSKQPKRSTLFSNRYISVTMWDWAELLRRLLAPANSCKTHQFLIFLAKWQKSYGLAKTVQNPRKTFFLHIVRSDAQVRKMETVQQVPCMWLVIWVMGVSDLKGFWKNSSDSGDTAFQKHRVFADLNKIAQNSCFGHFIDFLKRSKSKVRRDIKKPLRTQSLPSSR